MADPTEPPPLGPAPDPADEPPEPPPGSALAAALELVGDRWTLQIVAALLGGPRRFNEIAEAVPRVAPNVLSARLRHLEAAALAVARPYSSRPPRLRYQLTARGSGLAAVIDALIRWESSGGWPEGFHDECGTPLEPGLVCPRCGVAVDRRPGDWFESDQLTSGAVEL
jgi:DNA-binding HxlR family transcriptional regulator